jgi:hypothetical protein
MTKLKRAKWWIGGLIVGLLWGSLVLVEAQNFSSIQVGSGSSFAPSITFLSDNKKGFYDNGTNSIGASVNQIVGMTLSQSTAQDVELVFRNHLVTNRLGETAPAFTGQGTPTCVGSCSDSAGILNITTGGTGTLTITFAKAYLQPPICFVNDQTTTGANPGKVATTKTTAIWTPLATTTTSDQVGYFCIGAG